MQVSKDSVLQALRTYGTQEQIEQAQRLLSDPVDTDRDGDLLRDLGLDPGGSSAGGGMAVTPTHRPDVTTAPGPAAHPERSAGT